MFSLGNWLEMFRECPICKQRSTYLFKSKLLKDIYECSNLRCGHFFTQPMTDLQGICDRNKDLEKESDSSLKFFHERNTRLLGLFLSKLNKKEGPVVFLDYGAGNAHVSRSFKQNLGNKCEIYCMEANPECKNLYDKYDLNQVKHINELQKKVDMVYLIEVIEHLVDPIFTLKSLKKILKPKGKIFISTPLGKREESLTNAYETQSHLHFFTEKSLNLALTKAKLSEIFFDYYPEMYPIPKLYSIRGFFKNIKSFVNHSRTSYHDVSHLVGFSELKDKD